MFILVAWIFHIWNFFEIWDLVIGIYLVEVAGRSAAWLARLPWEQEVGRSNRLAPTIFLFLENFQLELKDRPTVGEQEGVTLWRISHSSLSRHRVGEMAGDVARNNEQLFVTPACRNVLLHEGKSNRCQVYTGCCSKARFKNIWNFKFRWVIAEGK